MSEGGRPTEPATGATCCDHASQVPETCQPTMGTIRSREVKLEELVPRVTDAEREDKDVDQLIPWVFRTSRIVEESHIEEWPGEGRLKDFFKNFINYHDEVPSTELVDNHESHNTRALGSTVRISGRERITLSRKNWREPMRERHKRFLNWQGTMLSDLMKGIYQSLEALDNEVTDIKFPMNSIRLQYQIRGGNYAAQPEGTVIDKLGVPIISFNGWYEGQTWGDSLRNTLSVMLGQLTKSLRRGAVFPEQRVYIVGFFGKELYIALGLFSSDLITRAQSTGCLEDFEILISPGYNLCLQENWIEAIRGLTRLFRYLLGDHTRIDSIQS
ncbi:hypothetical protein BDW42DRAFT_173826 [Aspergillus taichungensis]|uniref:Uncharacterized protein n=1 Tax=Aspergillus taichungensis TaxID=482145 RepID=A0A2J5HPC6_9EURO|nr:hypothetical protein BDW42DRAFT_173826 [Aspergillus taichungensis]